MMYRVGLISIAVVLAGATISAGSKSLISMTSDAGDIIGLGQSRVFTPVEGTFGVSRNSPNGITVNFNGGSANSWTFEFASPLSQPIEPGNYENAQRYSSFGMIPTLPGMSVSGQSRSCSTSSGAFYAGRFVVHEVVYAGSGSQPAVLRLNIEFEQRCSPSAQGSALRGRIIYSTKGSPLGDRDWDRKSELTVFRPSTGLWHSLQSGSGLTTSIDIPWGTAGDLPVPEDFDGDGAVDFVVYRNTTWYALLSSRGYTTMLASEWGTPTDIPAAGDYDGDGRGDFGLFRPASGMWLIRRSGTNYGTVWTFAWGQDGDVPVPADFDGDGKTDIAVWRPSSGIWLVLLSANMFTTSTFKQWGTLGDTPVAADYDADGKADYAVFRRSSGTWWVSFSSTSAILATQWGMDSDVVTPADFNSDGLADQAVFRPSVGVWFVRGLFAFPWGLSGDIPEIRRQ